MSDVTQEQVDELVKKPRSQWTAADRVLLTKARKAGLKVELPDPGPTGAAPKASGAAGGLSPEEGPKEAPPKKKEAPAAEAPKKAEPDVMGPYLQVLYRMRVGTEDVSLEKVAEFKSKADGWLKEVAEAMGQEDFTLEDLSKKDITLRQRYERAMLIFEGIEKLTEASLPGGPGGRPRKSWAEKKDQIFKGIFKRG